MSAMDDVLLLDVTDVVLLSEDQYILLMEWHVLLHLIESKYW
jgi:hypothetical protein